MSERTNDATPGTWVVGFDGSECARHAALWAVGNAAGRAGEIRLLSAWSVPVTAYYPPATVLPPKLADDIEAGTRETAEGLAEAIGPSTTVPVTTAVACGGAAHMLLHAAEDAEMVVVGSRGRGGFARLLLGSTSTQVATHSPVPTVVVPHDAEIGTAEKIVVAIDGSPNSLAALDWTLEFARPGSSIDCVMVWDISPLVVGNDQFAIPEASGAAEQRLEHVVATRRASHGNGLKVGHRFVEGAARHELERAAADADLLVMGARGHGAIGAAILGSVSTWLLHHTHVPMVVVPTPADDEDADRSAGDDSAEEDT